MVRVPRNLDSLLYNCPVLDCFPSVISSRLTMNSVCFSPTPVQLLTVLVDCWFEIEEFFNKLAISSSEFQRQIIFSQKTDGIRASVLNIWSHSFLFSLLISSSLSLMLSCAVPNLHLVPLGSTALFGRPSASLEFLHSLSLSMRSVQDTTPEGVLSSCGYSLTLTLTTSVGTWYGAGVMKGVTSHAAHKGILRSAGATKSRSSVVLLSYSCRISLYIRSNCSSSGWATRVINFRFLVLSSLFITRIRQETINLVIRSHPFRHPLKTGSRSGTNLLFSF